MIAAVDRIRDVLNQLREGATVEHVFGAPIEAEGRTIVPVAEVKVGMGVGVGSRHWTGGVDDETPEGTREGAEGTDEGEGAGGGGGLTARPVAIVEITPEDTRVIPIVDERAVWRGRVILGGLCVAALFLLARGRQRRRDDEE